MLVIVLTCSIFYKVSDISCAPSVINLIWDKHYYDLSKSVEHVKIEPKFKIILRNESTDTNKCPCYEYDENICKYVNDRLLCGYNKNFNNEDNNRKENVQLSNNCDIHEDRIECGYKNTQASDRNSSNTTDTNTDPSILEVLTQNIILKQLEHPPAKTTIFGFIPKTRYKNIVNSAKSTVTDTTINENNQKHKSEGNCQLQDDRVECGYKKKHNISNFTNNNSNMSVNDKKEATKIHNVSKLSTLKLEPQQLTINLSSQSTRATLIASLTDFWVSLSNTTNVSTSTVTASTALKLLLSKIKTTNPRKQLLSTSKSFKSTTHEFTFVSLPPKLNYFSMLSTTNRKSGSKFGTEKITTEKNKICQNLGNKVECEYEKENEVIGITT